MDLPILIGHQILITMGHLILMTHPQVVKQVEALLHQTAVNLEMNMETMLIYILKTMFPLVLVFPQVTLIV